MNIHDNMIDLVGKTPIVRLNRMPGAENALVAAKLEFFNPCSSVKDRIAVNMIARAEGKGLLAPGATIIEPTSGNTGIGLAFAAAIKGYDVVLTMPESLSMERRALLKGLGAKLVLTPAEKGMAGAVAEAENILARTPGGFMPQQFKNPDNPATHEASTALEIIEDTEGKVDIFVAGVGTGGTITGTGKILKKHNPAIRVVAVEPLESAVLSGNAPGPHGIQGIGAGFVPEALDRSVIDEILPVASADAVNTAKTLMKKEGIMAGISAGGAAHAALTLARRPENKDKLIVFIAPDTAERYLSTDLFG